MPHAPLRLFHCDDSPAFLRLVEHWLDEYDWIEHVGAACDCETALPRLAEARPDVVLLDTMGRPGDPTFLRDVRALTPEARLIVYSGFVNIVESGDLGGQADAYVEKGEDERDLIATIRAVTGKD